MGLFDTGSKGVKFTNPGDSITGTVTGNPREQQSTKFGSTDLDYWPNGDPKMQILVDLHTAERLDGDDDGDRTLYVSSTAQKKAIGEAMRAAGASDIEKGGTLTVTFTGYDQASKNPANPKKLYTASYVKPNSVFGNTDTTSSDAWPDAAPAPAAAPPAGGMDADTTEKVQRLLGLGLQPEQITAAVGVSAEQIAALQNA